MAAPTKSPSSTFPQVLCEVLGVSRSHTAMAAQSPSAECPPEAAEPSGTAIQEGSESSPNQGGCVLILSVCGSGSPT